MNFLGVYLLTFVLLVGTVVTANTQDILPAPEKPIPAQVGRTWKDSKPGKIPSVRAPENAPNVVIVLLDDVGFGAAGSFGGPVPTPTLDRLAKHGLRYNAFHTTALCSPTRAALLTGRNHHSVGSGQITEMATGFDGYTSIIPKSTATIAELLRQHGYNTSAWGKWHNTPVWETSISGPFDRWPTGMGFERFYGFIGGESHQYEPPLYDGTRPVERPKRPDYTLNQDLADQAIAWMRLQKSIAPEKPFFVYFAPGATHAPHHVPKEWSDKFKGRFDRGWDALRQETFDRQRKLGIVPADTKLTPRPEQIPAWDSLSPERKKIASRLMEIYAGYLAQTDNEVGRVINAIEQLGIIENTLVIFIVGDNGASGEGTPFGVLNEMSVLNGVPEDPSVVMKHLDELGGPTAYNHYPVGFAWACDTPFQWTKQVASHFGGTRNGMVVSWPKRIKDAGGLRTQFHHCIDIVPTILEAVGISEPYVVNGVPQKPIEGVSMLYTFDDSKSVSRRKTQYFEMMGNRAVYDNGWIASCFHGRVPWVFSLSPHRTFDNEKWELYNLSDDFSQSNDVAEKYPEKLRALQDLFWVEAAKHNVLPLDDRGGERVERDMLPIPGSVHNKFTFYSGATRIPEAISPSTKNRSFVITADLEIPKNGAEGVVAAVGGVVGGWSLYVKDGKPSFTYNYLTSERPTITSPAKLEPGPARIQYEFVYDGGGMGKGGIGKLSVNNQVTAEGRIERTVPLLFSCDETFDVGTDTGSPVGLYPTDFAFTGTIKSVQIELK
jgi:arylsulfatase